MLQLKEKKSLCLDGYTVILPSICVGNASQLACDLLICSKSLERIGSLSHRAIIPIYGPSAYQHKGDKSAACEIYRSELDKLVVFQFRAPFISTHMRSLHDELANIVEKAQRVIILSGSFSFERRVIEESPYQYKATENFKRDFNDKLKTMSWKEFDGDIIHGGGNATALYKLLAERGVSTMVLFRYLLDGDNTMDASMILRELNELCGYFLDIGDHNRAMNLKIPISWKFLFGNDVIESLF